MGITLLYLSLQLTRGSSAYVTQFRGLKDSIIQLSVKSQFLYIPLRSLHIFMNIIGLQFQLVGMVMILLFMIPNITFRYNNIRS